ncbi:30S ribosomal protein S15 [bacterium]|nr:30S ribosomal protein S15 [bacterium]
MAIDLEVEGRKGVIAEFQHHAKDTGSAEVQVALLTQRILELNKHLTQHKKDNHSRRGLLLMVSKRRKFLAYLQKRNYPKYLEVIKALGLRK